VWTVPPAGCGGGDGTSGGGPPARPDATALDSASLADSGGGQADVENGPGDTSTREGSDASSNDSSGASSDDASGRSDAGPAATGSLCSHVAPGDYEQYGLPPTTSLASGVSASTNWTQHPAHGGWYGAQQMDACRYQADSHGFLTWHGMAAARVEVDPGDDPLNLGAGSERAECLTQQSGSGNQISEMSSSGTQYYATSYYFSNEWAATFYPYSVFESSGTGWPHNTASNCASAGNACNSWSLVLQFYPWASLAAGSTAPGQPQTLWFDVGSQKFSFSDGGQIVLGAWMDLVIQVNWSSAAIAIWRRNEGLTSFTQVVNGTATSAAPSAVYVKQGLYRGANVNGRTDVLWVGPTARGSSFSAVEQAAFGTNGGP
jgi:hypothetical protein